VCVRERGAASVSGAIVANTVIGLF
jgi:hypothetical protein